jgi:copper chaperone NosL
MKNISLLTAVFFSILFVSCKRSFQPIEYGKEACSHCKMTIMDKKFACEIVDKKGKVFKFDDMLCMKDFANDKKMNDEELLLFVADYKNPDSKFLDVKNAYLLQSEVFKTPMNGHVAAFSSSEEVSGSDQTNAQPIGWSNLK